MGVPGFVSLQRPKVWILPSEWWTQGGGQCVHPVEDTIAFRGNPLFFANHYSAYCAPPPPLNLTVAANKSRVPAQKLQLFPRILQLFSPNLRQMDFSLTRSQKIQSWGREGSLNVQKYKKYPHLYQQLPRVMHWRQGGRIQSNFALICITGMHFITLHSSLCIVLQRDAFVMRACSVLHHCILRLCAFNCDQTDICQFFHTGRIFKSQILQWLKANWKHPEYLRALPMAPVTNIRYATDALFGKSGAY